MSSLIFHTQPDMAIVATDTLAVNEAGTPVNWTTKAILIPHLQMIVAGTGVAGVCSRWFLRINEDMAVHGIEHLDVHTPQGLVGLYARYSEEVGFPPELSTTIYHFGISEISGEVVAFAYRSENGFRSERLSHGLKCKPECDVEMGDDLRSGLIQMMDSQRAIQAAKPAAERIHIGGAIQVLHLTNANATSVRLHTFNDFADQESAIYR